MRISTGPAATTDPTWMSVTLEVAGGLFTWLSFPQGFDATDFMRTVALPQARVAYVPGATFFPLTPRPNHARLNFSAPSIEMIQTGIAALGKALHANLSS